MTHNDLIDPTATREVTELKLRKLKVDLLRHFVTATKLMNTAAFIQDGTRVQNNTWEGNGRVESFSLLKACVLGFHLLSCQEDLISLLPETLMGAAMAEEEQSWMLACFTLTDITGHLGRRMI